MPIRPLTAGKSIKILTYGDSGWGKTRLAGTSTGKILFLRPPVDHTDSVRQQDKRRCDEWVLHDWSEAEDAFETLRHAKKGGKDSYDWIWFDSVSAYQEIGLDDLWDTIITEKPHRKRWGLDKGDYWINMQRLGRWVRDMVTLSDSGAFNFGVTAWIADMAPSEDEEKPRKLMPWVQGKNMASKVCGYMNIVAFCDYTSKGTRCLRLQESERFIAKDQFDMFDKYVLLNPTMDKIEGAVARRNGQSTTRRKRRVRREQ
jgi:AAA domain